jgi:hypothetical protein
MKAAGPISRKQGFQEKRVAELVLLYAGGDPNVAEQGLKLADSYAAQLKRCGEQLNSLAASVQAVQELCRKRGRYFQDDRLPDRMRNFAELILEEAEIQTKGLSKIKLGSSAQSGRDWALAYLTYFLSGGEKPPGELYQQIAKLVAAVGGKAEANYVTMADALRKVVQRFLKDAPYRSLLIENAHFEFETRNPVRADHWT